MTADRLIAGCPVGCGTDLVETDIAMAEGNLFRYIDCGHPVSQIQESSYRGAWQKFDSERGTLPLASSQEQYDQRAARLFTQIRTALGLCPEDRMRMLDIGCSTGALIISALRERIDAEGVEPEE